MTSIEKEKESSSSFLGSMAGPENWSDENSLFTFI